MTPKIVKTHANEAHWKELVHQTGNGTECHPGGGSTEAVGAVIDSQAGQYFLVKFPKQGNQQALPARGCAHVECTFVR